MYFLFVLQVLSDYYSTNVATLAFLIENMFISKKIENNEFVKYSGSRVSTLPSPNTEDTDSREF